MNSPKLLHVVSVTVASEVEADWNTWYDTVHLPEILSCPGFQNAARYVGNEPDGSRRYLTIYEIDSLAALQSSEFQRKRGWGPFLKHVQPTVLQYRLVSAMDGSPAVRSTE
jgi:hypothetical protein